MLTRSLFGFPVRGLANPFSELERMRRDMDRLSDALFGKAGSRLLTPGAFPAVNITEDKDHYFVRAELPGISAENIDVQVNGRNLSIVGERKIQSEGANVKYHRREREPGKFSRVIGLPSDIDVNKVEAQMNNGILTVTVAKAEAAKPKQITIKS